MTRLQSNALGRLPLPVMDVETIYRLNEAGLRSETIRKLCESHERLRAELAGAESVIADLCPAAPKESP